MKRNITAAVILLVLATACGRGIDPADSGTTTTTSTSPTTTTLVEPGPGPDQPAPGPLVIWVDPIRAPAAALAAADFTAALGIEVVVEELPIEAIFTGVQSRSAEPPDVFFGEHVWIPDLVAEDLIEPVALTGRRGEFTKIGAGAFMYEGELYGLPTSVTAAVLLFDSTRVEDAPSGFSQIKATCEGLGDSIEACVTIPTDDPDFTWPFLSARGGYLFGTDETGYSTSDVGLDSRDAIAGAAFLRGLIDDGVVTAALDEQEATQRLALGETAFIFAGLRAASDLASRGVPFTALPLPSMGGWTPAPFVNASGFFLSARSAQPEAAATFLREYLATPTIMAALLDSVREPPANLATVQQALQDPLLAAVLDSAGDGMPTPTVPDIDEARTALGVALALLYGEEADVAALLRAAADEIRAMYSTEP